MRSGFIKTLLFAALACLLVPACATKDTNTADATGELGIAEVVVRHMVAEAAPGEAVYVSFGRSWHDRVDPPAEFLERLGDIDVDFRPVSAYSEQASGTPLLLVVHIGGGGEGADAEVRVIRYRFGAGGADGFTATVSRSDGGWRINEQTGSWSS